jgi:hypothetical protein
VGYTQKKTAFVVKKRTFFPFYNPRVSPVTEMPHRAKFAVSRWMRLRNHVISAALETALHGKPLRRFNVPRRSAGDRA